MIFAKFWLFSCMPHYQRSGLHGDTAKIGDLTTAQLSLFNMELHKFHKM